MNDFLLRLLTLVLLCTAFNFAYDFREEGLEASEALKLERPIFLVQDPR